MRPDDDRAHDDEPEGDMNDDRQDPPLPGKTGGKAPLDPFVPTPGDAASGTPDSDDTAESGSS